MEGRVALRTGGNCDSRFILSIASNSNPDVSARPEECRSSGRCEAVGVRLVHEIVIVVGGHHFMQGQSPSDLRVQDPDVRDQACPPSIRSLADVLLSQGRIQTWSKYLMHPLAIDGDPPTACRSIPEVVHGSSIDLDRSFSGNRVALPKFRFRLCMRSDRNDGMTLVLCLVRR